MVSDERAADVIARDLERRIISGELANNKPLPPEKDLSSEYGASRTVVREAITALTNRGMLENRPRFRPTVRKPGFDAAFSTMGGIVQNLMGAKQGVETLFQSRVFLERALVREAAVRAQSADIRDLRAALAANKESINSSEEFHATDTDFHRVFYQIPRNPIFPAVHEAYTQWLAAHWKKMERSPERNAMNYQNHKAIYEAVLERDADAAESHLERHLVGAWEQIQDTF
ncbi:MAG: DNA-binding FadR family transcriptional regulator [bacterium]